MTQKPEGSLVRLSLGVDLGHRDSSAGRGPCLANLVTAFNPWSPWKDGKREATPQICPPVPTDANRVQIACQSS